MFLVTSWQKLSESAFYLQRGTKHAGQLIKIKKHEGNGPIDSRAMVTITDNKSAMLNIASRLSYFTGTEIISVNPDKRESPNIIHWLRWACRHSLVKTRLESITTYCTLLLTLWCTMAKAFFYGAMDPRCLISCSSKANNILWVKCLEILSSCGPSPLVYGLETMSVGGVVNDPNI